MSDNTTINLGTGGDSIATDDIGSIKFQRIKLIHGADGVNAGDVSSTNGLPVEVVKAAPLTIDSDQFDDDGYQFINTNVPGADISTGDKQSQQLAALLQLLTTPGMLGNIQSIAAPVTVSAVNSIPLAANAAVENVGNLQRIADLTELMLAELRVISSSIAQLQSPQVDGAEQLRNDFTLIQ